MLLTMVRITCGVSAAVSDSAGSSGTTCAARRARSRGPSPVARPSPLAPVSGRRRASGRPPLLFGRQSLCGSLWALGAGPFRGGGARGTCARATRAAGGPPQPGAPARASDTCPVVGYVTRQTRVPRALQTRARPRAARGGRPWSKAPRSASGTRGCQTAQACRPCRPRARTVPGPTRGAPAGAPLRPPACCISRRRGCPHRAHKEQRDTEPPRRFAKPGGRGGHRSSA